MATKKISSKKPALKHTPKTQRTTPIEITFTLEEVQTWPPVMRRMLHELVRLHVHCVEMKLKRAKWRLKYHTRKLAA
jgi:hypothetical protein